MTRREASDRLHAIMARAADMMAGTPRGLFRAYSRLQSRALDVVNDAAAPWEVVEPYAAHLLDRMRAALDDIARADG